MVIESNANTDRKDVQVKGTLHCNECGGKMMVEPVRGGGEMAVCTATGCGQRMVRWAVTWPTATLTRINVPAGPGARVKDQR